MNREHFSLKTSISGLKNRKKVVCNNCHFAKIGVRLHQPEDRLVKCFLIWSGEKNTVNLVRFISTGVREFSDLFISRKDVASD